VSSPDLPPDTKAKFPAGCYVGPTSPFLVSRYAQAVQLRERDEESPVLASCSFAATHPFDWVNQDPQTFIQMNILPRAL